MRLSLRLLVTLALLQVQHASARALHEQDDANPQFRFEASQGFPILNEQDPDLDSWNLTLGPAENTTDNFIFDTVSSLLQHWPGMRHRNGHTIVPGTIPPGTLLFHGTYHPNVPTHPEWTATNPEFSHNFCRSQPEVEGCWFLTLTTVRSLRVLYFDGNSAAKLDNGPVDSQDILLWGKAKPEWVFDERRRLTELCEWGKKFKLDGFVRLSADFEVMLCDFTAGLEVVSFLNLVKEGLPWGSVLDPSIELDHDYRPPSNTDADTVTMMRPPDMLKLKIIESSAWARSYPGETRVRLDLSNLISFYDTELFPSLAPTRVGQERWDHRVAGISHDDARALVEAVEHSLEDEFLTKTRGHGIDWQAQFQVLVNRFAGRIETLQYVLNGTIEGEQNGDAGVVEQLDYMRIIQRAVHEIKVMVNTYTMLYLAPPPEGSDAEHSWARPAFKYCATTYTKGVKSAIQHSGLALTRSEKLMLGAYEGTNREICRVLINMWAASVELGFEDRTPSVWTPEEDGDEERLEELVVRWREDVDGLMKWLDWSAWVKCRPACGPEEICYVPTWPWLFNVKLPNRNDTSVPLPPGEDEARPTPRCIRRLEPYTW